MTDPERKKSFLSIFEQISKNHTSEHKQNGHPYRFGRESKEQEDEEDSFEGDDESSCVLSDEIDHHILMHRDAHFGGDFNVMLDYYNNEEHIGINPDFDVERISYLSEIEKDMDQDLAPLFLTGAEAEAVGRARRAYGQLKEIYEIEHESIFPRLIADLILSEVEEPLQEIEATVSQGTTIVPELLALLNADDFYDPLFPGYGYAPYLAILCLGKIGDKRAVIPLFETLSKQMIFDEMAIVEALVNIGEPAKEFLLQILKSRPLTQDNSNAAFALISFCEDPQVAIACFEQLQNPEVQEKPLLTTYLLCNCQFLNSSFYRHAFIKMASDPNISSVLRKEMQHIINEWKQQ